jgi:hypothetical protein
MRNQITIEAGFARMHNQRAAACHYDLWVGRAKETLCSRIDAAR